MSHSPFSNKFWFTQLIPKSLIIFVSSLTSFALEFGLLYQTENPIFLSQHMQRNIFCNHAFFMSLALSVDMHTTLYVASNILYLDE